MSVLTLGSLFDGSGGFPLAAMLSGIKPIWASEVDPFAIRVTTKRLPEMAHFGNIQMLRGDVLPPVDIISFGSPCQDMSIAGKRQGIAASRSGLFFEAVRIIKEMRYHTHGKYPRYALWENVPGAFSSNTGQDFLSVLEALIRIKDETISIPQTKWTGAGEILGEDYSLAWRVLDAQYFGVPQRRRRIYLVCDFGGRRAGEILFKPDCLSGNFKACFASWQELSCTLDVCLKKTGSLAGDLSSLSPHTSQTSVQKENQLVFEPYPRDTHSRESFLAAPATTARLGSNDHNQPLVIKHIAYGFNALSKKRGSGRYGYPTNISKTLDTKGINPSCHQGGIAVVDRCFAASSCGFSSVYEECAPTLLASDDKHAPFIKSVSRIRRLTPTECARLQGFPDSWCQDLEEIHPSTETLVFWQDVFFEWQKAEGKVPKQKSERQIKTWLACPASDSAQYRLWGNGIALPCAAYVLGNISLKSAFYLV